MMTTVKCQIMETHIIAPILQLLFPQTRVTLLCVLKLIVTVADNSDVQYESPSVDDQAIELHLQCHETSSSPVYDCVHLN